MELILGYIAGLLTLINPCVLPVLPIVLASALQAGRHGPLAIAAGLCLSFVIFGMVVATIGHSIGLTEQVLARTGAVLMIGFGLVLLVPRFNQSFATATASIGAGADGVLSSVQSTNGSTLRTQFIGGVLLGAVWSPCIGPTLGGAISLASQGQNLSWAFLIMLSFGLGISTVIVALGYGTGQAVRKRKDRLQGLAEKAKPLLGITFLLVGVMIFFKIHHQIEALLVDVLPYWIQDLSIRY
ncbi:MAG: cytochrome c biogenesis CcdA family protein [Granulosicoccus sp.]